MFDCIYVKCKDEINCRYINVTTTILFMIIIFNNVLEHFPSLRSSSAYYKILASAWLNSHIVVLEPSQD